jgi:outer membrane protein OmpA-like peptidoglycan-associated protein
MSTLGQVRSAAPAVDVALLVEEANANVGKGGVAALPNWSKLAEVSQLIVEIDFENNSVAIEPKSYRTVGLIADALHHPDLFRYKFLIVGYSSATGSAKHNLERGVVDDVRGFARSSLLGWRGRSMADRRRPPGGCR